MGLIIISDFSRMLCNVIYSSIMVVGVIGNVMVITVILKIKDMRNSTNIFLAHLAVADLMNLLIWGAKSLFELNSERELSDLNKGTCKTLPFFIDLAIDASILIILTIGFERYYAVCQPFKASYTCTKSRANKICVLLWSLAALFSSPELSFFVYLPETERTQAKVLQSMVYEYDGAMCIGKADSPLKHPYYYADAILFFFLPMIILAILFLIILRHLKRSASLSVNMAAIRHRYHIIKMLISVVLCLFVCHLPYRVISLLDMVKPETLNQWLGVDNYNLVINLCQSMIYLHSAVNPILYNLMSKRFRVGFKSIFCDT